METNTRDIMKSETVKRILLETPIETKQKATDYGNALNNNVLN